MFSTHFISFALAIAFATILQAREWTDATGKYTIAGDVIAYGNSSAVIKKQNGDLVAVPIAKLSKADRDYLKHQDPVGVDKQGESTQSWRLRSGLKLRGKLIDFHQHDLVVQRRLGRVYVNNQRFDKLPAVYREIVPKIVEHFTWEKVDGEKGLVAWARTQKGKPRKFRCDGFLVELEDGNLYCVPFILFSDATLKTLKPGWEQWLAAKEDHEKKEEQSFLLRTQAEAYEKERERTKQIQQLQLNLQAYEAGVFDLWEVAMYPPPGRYGIPLSVIVPAMNSIQAKEVAKQKNPSYVVGPMRIVRRRN
tara:strand:- start:40132 stop:41052 length:921 start_codon:yes stop_codon:yes gene_type:complete